MPSGHREPDVLLSLPALLLIRSVTLNQAPLFSILGSGGRMERAWEEAVS